MKRNLATVKAARHAKSLPRYEARKAAELAEKIRTSRETLPFNSPIAVSQFIGKR